MHNIRLFFRNPQGCLLWTISIDPAGLHFQTQAIDEMFGVKRQRRAALYRDVSIEFGGFDDPKLFDTGEAAMGDGELIDHGNTEPRLDQRADRRAEPRTDGYVVLEFLAGKDLGHDAPIGIGRINANQRITDDFRRRDLLAARKLMPDRHDAEQLARRKRQEVEAGV